MIIIRNCWIIAFFRNSDKKCRYMRWKNCFWMCCVHVCVCVYECLCVRVCVFVPCKSWQQVVCRPVTEGARSTNSAQPTGLSSCSCQQLSACVCVWGDLYVCVSVSIPEVGPRNCFESHKYVCYKSAIKSRQASLKSNSLKIWLLIL